ncbi:MAG: T9SS type A sorting domain-containing protein [Candidatus Marinimicrobia bacterium]|jgi:hypothetical protein|uniref:Secretion system C-terminal sorting domain-containing protein n=1 Tax=uncultured bacterium FPPU_33B15 TaxID=1343848 RepID=S4WB59_9BACT|nr:hypothetical protein [uncultured bacterium FPPU_33B15]MBT3839303.1 T9SS type A sorting domain-containing protein [Candidatus Neomarinimicrobiota bacterium]MBT3998658.1 T9SS type A sorting domain-containing protein [Candidatus Neomarinimicrobiota bacterium]MBT4382372.1 T9SS type A sorting domain-containing protein [Candidatus Neomarinimicrobiota bacterium]MBT4579407.1 T9SS type A sorting domain-containing protein [Candidatus Neomarinimicrobiota bacterium]
MRSILWILTSLSFLLAKDITFKLQTLKNDSHQLISISGASNNQNQPNFERSSRDDTSTIWLDDLEGDISGWTVAPEWELTDESSFSPSNSFHMDDDNYDVVSSIVSPLISVPELTSESELLKLNFALWCDFPDFDGAGDNFLEDYYWVDIANLSDVPVYFHETATDAYEGQSWGCSDPAIGGYLDAWVQVLQTPTITVPAVDPTLSAMMKWGLEDYAGATVAGTCTDGWDAANVRISNDGGITWNLLVGSDPYDFDYGYGWIYNDPEYDCGGSLEQVAAGWGGQADWHEVTFGLGDYSGQDVIIQFAFGSDPSYSFLDDNSLTGLMVDNIFITDGSGSITFQDNADDENSMLAMNGMEFAWEQFFYDYGDATRPGSLGWEVYPSGAAFNGNAELDISSYAGADIKIRFTGRTDDNDDGGNGEGLFIDDVHIWNVMYNDVPMVNNLAATAGDNQVVVSWDMPAGGTYTNEDISYVDGTMEDAIFMSSGTSIMGEYFDMPYGVEAVFANSVEIWGVEGNSGETTVFGYEVVAGVPVTTATFSSPITLVEGQWNTLNVNWTFSGDFLIAIEVSETIAIGIDSDNAPGQNSWANLGGWQPWTEVAIENSLTDGEFGVNANVTTIGGSTPVFNVYRSMNGDEFNIMFNGAGINGNEYVDNTSQNGNEYCYQITSIYGDDESNPAGPVCVIPEAQTIYEIAYDDGSDETSINAGNMNTLCVKFTPSGYPADLYRASFFTVGTSNAVAFVNVWDDDGENGMPGTLLVTNVPITFAGGTWTPVSLASENIIIEDGSFYIGWMETEQTPPVGVDSNSPSTNSYIDVGIGAGFEPFGTYFEGAFMIRAELDSVNVLGLNDGFEDNLPKSFGLKQNYPNPFNPTTTIRFDLAGQAKTVLSLYDVSGREVMTLINKDLSAGQYTFSLNAGDFPSGMYFYKLTAQDQSGQIIFSSTKKLVLMK